MAAQFRVCFTFACFSFCYIPSCSLVFFATFGSDFVTRREAKRFKIHLNDHDLSSDDGVCHTLDLYTQCLGSLAGKSLRKQTFWWCLLHLVSPGFTLALCVARSLLGMQTCFTGRCKQICSLFLGFYVALTVGRFWKKDARV